MLNKSIIQCFSQCSPFVTFGISTDLICVYYRCRQILFLVMKFENRFGIKWDRMGVLGWGWAAERYEPQGGLVGVVNLGWVCGIPEGYAHFIKDWRYVEMGFGWWLGLRVKVQGDKGSRVQDRFKEVRGAGFEADAKSTHSYSSDLHLSVFQNRPDRGA